MIRALLIPVLLSIAFASEPAASVFAQDSQPKVPSMTGLWDFTFDVTKGNDTDRKRLGFLQAEYRCAQGGTRLVCRTADGKIILKGSTAEDGVALALGENVTDGSTTYVNCYNFGCYGGSYDTGYSVAMQLRGKVTEPTYARGDWTAVIKVDFSNYPVEGKWEAIKVQ